MKMGLEQKEEEFSVHFLGDSDAHLCHLTCSG